MHDHLLLADVATVSPGRLGAILAALVGLTGVVLGGLALRRPAGRSGPAGRRLGALGALAAGLLGLAIGALVVATSEGGIGTGNGRAGGYVALALGLIATALGALALVRGRRARPAAAAEVRLDHGR
jgi:hypothetical protein